MIWSPNVVGGQDQVPAVLYHGTSRKKWKKRIKIEGLRPSRPRAYVHGEPDWGVWLTNNPALVEQHPGNGDKPVVVEVDVQDLNLLKAGFGPTYVSLLTIPPERLRRYREQG